MDGEVKRICGAVLAPKPWLMALSICAVIMAGIPRDRSNKPDSPGTTYTQTLQEDAAVRKAAELDELLRLLTPDQRRRVLGPMLPDCARKANA